MSPFRVKVSKSNAQELVLSAMLHYDKILGYVIYILEKHADQVDGQVVFSFASDKVEEYRQRAHRISGKVNSSILAKYLIKKDEDYRRYRVFDANNVCITKIEQLEYTLSDCLVSAMNHYCKLHRFNIDLIL